MADRLDAHGDIWAELLAQGESLAGPIGKLERLGARLEVPVIRRFGGR
jgi:hypothetical protein